MDNAPAQHLRTLKQALQHVWDTDWKHRRSGECLKSQATTAVDDLLGYYPTGSDPMALDITPPRIQVVTALWYDAGLAPATITKRLNCLSKLGVNVAGCKPPKAKVLQWWLNPELARKLDAHLRSAEGFTAWDARLMRLYVAWATTTGLRVEETLRLTWAEVYRRDGRWSVTVPGTKTSTAQATLPLSPRAGMVLDDLNSIPTGPHVFSLPYGEPVPYDYLEALWGRCRNYLGVSHVPTATLKALRRTAARHLHIEQGMPLDMVREYLRHEDIETTQGYLKLVGGYAAKEMEKFL